MRIMSVLTSHDWPASFRLDHLADTTDELHGSWGGRSGPAWRNAQGGDVGCGGRRAMLRHTANYAMAAQVTASAAAPGPLVDVGCGTGLHSHWLANALDRPLWLVDPDPTALAAARARGHVERCFGSLGEVPSGSAAVVTAMEVIEHVERADQQRFVSDLRRIAQPRATVVISTPDESIYRGGHSGYAPHVGTLDAASLERLMASGGLPAMTWRISGDAFETSRIERVALPTLNRVHARLRQVAPGPVGVVSVAVAGLVRRIQLLAPSPELDTAGVIARPTGTAVGTGLIAASVVDHDG